MSLQSVTVQVPEKLYAALAQRAAQTKRTVADELVNVAAHAVAGDSLLPDDLAGELDALATAPDERLWHLAQSRLTGEEASRLEQFHWQRSAGPLAPRDEDEAAALLQKYERCLVLRAHAMGLLKERGRDISAILKP
jgi:hypothetical protein